MSRYALAISVFLGASLLMACGAMASEGEPLQSGTTTAKPVAAPAATTTAPGNGWDRYKVLLQRNIFSKSSDSGENKPAAGNATLSPEAQIVLMGVLQKDAALSAILEDRKAKTILTLRQGDAVGLGTLGNIGLDQIEYLTNGTKRQIKIGSALDGSASPAPADLPKAAYSTGTAPATTGSSETNAILERLRKQRQEELSK